MAGARTGEGPPTRGVVFIVGIGQRAPVATYKARTQEWLQDSAFWSDMNVYVGDWSQEVYGDVRSYAAPGAPLENRRDALVEFLRHQDLLAAAGGAVSGTANAFFGNAGSALANAASQSVTTRIGHRSPAPAHAASNSAATAGSLSSLLDPAMPSTPDSTFAGSTPSIAAVNACRTCAAASSGGWELGFAPPATPARNRCRRACASPRRNVSDAVFSGAPPIGDLPIVPVPRQDMKPTLVCGWPDAPSMRTGVRRSTCV